ncbi:MAG: ribonuclease HI [Methanobrevibacter thaueri]|nr:ribonuclease HI [Methanobrevibacter thaueri]
MDTYSYFTDGAATMINVNGKYIRKAGGWAFIQFKNGERQTQQKGGCKQTTNNEMELYAIYASIKHFQDNSTQTDKMEIYTDSGYCIGIYTQWVKNWEKNGWKKSNNKPIENRRLIKKTWKLINNIEENHPKITFIKVKGHSNNQLNNEVDKLAVEAKKTAEKTGETIGYNQQPDSILEN